MTIKSSLTALWLVGGFLLACSATANEHLAVEGKKYPFASNSMHVDGNGLVALTWNRLSDLLPLEIQHLSARDILAHLGSESSTERTKEEDPNLGADRFVSGIIPHNWHGSIKLGIFEATHSVQISIDWSELLYGAPACEGTSSLGQKLIDSGWIFLGDSNRAHHAFHQVLNYSYPDRLDATDSSKTPTSDAGTVLTLITHRPDCVEEVRLRFSR